MKKSGVLLPVFSLPSAYGIGCFSKEAYYFVDLLEKCGQSYWQILPLGTIGEGNSPYLSYSSFAGCELYIDLEQLQSDGLLSKEECDAWDLTDQTERVVYDDVTMMRDALLWIAYRRFQPASKYQRFLENNKEWIYDYAEYRALLEPGKDQEYFIFTQYKFLKQWLKLKKYANEKGIKIIGDIPFYVASDGADFWANQEMFQLDENGKQVVQGGCPPDSFAVDGQLWSNPVYDWDYLKKTGYEWWIRRLKHSFLLYDVLRLDHFRAFDEYFVIPMEDKTAVNGHWEKGPGFDFFEKVKEELGDVSLIAEDLGFLTESVKELQLATGYPGMKILEFAFGAWDDSAYLPHKYEENCVVYTGTHDNDTVMGWYETLPEQDREFLQHYLESSSIDITGELNIDLISLALGSNADTVIIPLQDYLGFGSEARINVPSTVGTNWEWRVKKKDITGKVSETIRDLTQKYRKNYHE